MPDNDVVKLKAALEKVATELSRQGAELEKKQRANEAKLHAVMKKSLKGLDPGLQAVVTEILANHPFSPFLQRPKRK